MEIELSKIKASLSYGKVVSSRWLSIIYFGIVLGFGILAGGLFLAVAGIAESDTNSLIGSILCFTFGLVSITVYIRILVSCQKLNKNIVLWLGDAVNLKAYSETLDFTTGYPLKVKIRVHYNLKGREHTQDSGGYMVGSKRRSEYHKIFFKYADREIDILYSPRYDQVMILKDK